MRPLTEIKKEYSLKDKKFPLNGVNAKRIIKASGLTYKQLGKPVGVSDQAIGNWVNNITLAPKNKVKKVFGQLKMTSDEDIDFLILHHPSEEIREQLQQRNDDARQRARAAKAKKDGNESKINESIDIDLDNLADQIINLTQVINQMSQNQKVFFANWKQLFEQLRKYSDEQAKQQNYLVSEIKSLRKEVQQKNVLIRELQR